MKRLLAILLSFLFALGNNVSYSTNSDEPFNNDGFYRVEGYEEPDYRYMTQNYSTLTSTGNCYAKSASREHGSLVHLEELSAYKNWIDYSYKGEIDSAYFSTLVDPNVYTFEGKADIVAPQACIVKTKSTDGGGHSMLLETTDGKYKIYVSGMERWFCCRSRKLPPDTDVATYTWSHTCNTYGYTIPQGYLIGIAMEGTTVTVVSSTGNSVTLEEFYRN